jgi:hypothetical protein
MPQQQEFAQTIPDRPVDEHRDAHDRDERPG